MVLKVRSKWSSWSKGRGGQDVKGFSYIFLAFSSPFFLHLIHFHIYVYLNNNFSFSVASTSPGDHISYPLF